MNKLTLSALLASTLIISACDKAEDATEAAMDKASEMTEQVGEAAAEHAEHAADAGKEMMDKATDIAKDKMHEMTGHAHAVGGTAQVHSVTEEYHAKMKAAGY